MSASTTIPFQGVYTALVTPFHADGTLDLESYRALIDAQIVDGVDGLVPCGTTGEATTLSDQEWAQVVGTCVTQVAGRVPVIAGAGSNVTAQAVATTKAAKELGVDGVLHVTPAYNKPSQEGLYRHFKEVAQETDLPVVLYNVPGRTGVDLLPETVERLAMELPTIVAIKEATGSIHRAQDILTRLAERRPDFHVFSGDDGVILPLLGIGGHGVISVISHLCCKELAQMFAAFHNGDLDKAQALCRRVTPLQPALFFESNPIPVKTALALQGRMKPVFRMPLCPLSEAQNEHLKTTLTDLGWLL